MKEIEELRKDLAALSQRLEALADKFEDRKWYNIDNHSLIKYNAADPNNCIGLRKGCWGTAWRFDSGDKITPATESEVTYPLVKEAERRGFKKGVVFCDVSDKNRYEVVNGLMLYKWDEDYNLYAIGADGGPHGIVFDGETDQWAVIVKEEWNIGGYKAEYGGCTVTFGCKTFYFAEVKGTLDFMDNHEMDAIVLHGHTVSRDTVQLILNGFNK